MYSVIMFACAVLFGIFAVLIYRGKTDLIHDYHQKNVTDLAGYCKAFGKSMGVMSAAMLLSGIVAVFGEKLLWSATAVLVAGLTVGIFCLCRVQKKYNGSLF